MKKLMIAAFLFFTAFSTQAQCEECPTFNDFKTDYCHTDSLFEGMCARFSDESNMFSFTRKGKFRPALTVIDANTESLIALAKDRKAKVSAPEILFIQEALAAWEKERMRLGYTFTNSGLGIKVVEEGTGKLPENGKKVTVHYRGQLENGEQFDASFDRGQPFSFVLGQGRVIKGWDQGIAKLKVGSKAWLMIPPELGYGSRGAGGGKIPPNATLFFYVEVVEAAE